MDTRTGRFTQPDPSGLEANPYLYAFGDPANVIDPSGLYPGEDYVNAIGGGIKKGAGFAKDRVTNFFTSNWSCAKSGIALYGTGVVMAGTIASAPESGGASLAATGALILAVPSLVDGVRDCF